MKSFTLLGARGGIGSIIGWFIRIVIYDICITGISDILGVSRMVALFIFLGILAVIALVVICSSNVLRLDLKIKSRRQKC